MTKCKHIKKWLNEWNDLRHFSYSSEEKPAVNGDWLIINWARALSHAQALIDPSKIIRMLIDANIKPQIKAIRVDASERKFLPVCQLARNSSKSLQMSSHGLIAN